MARNKRKYRFGLRMKLMLFTTVLAIITYTTSAFFLYFVYEKVSNLWSGLSLETFTVMTLLLGIIWSGILAYAAARFITKPLEKLEQVASAAADGDLTHAIEISHSDDEFVH
ncbi:HAMP domain-containing protein [Paracerasibacillus soli]|uniref:HAMP domain-containing protein n=1 Tax=Paracerasibacillus soli TaxID=480284 RepID=UPI00387E0C05